MYNVHAFLFIQLLWLFQNQPNSWKQNWNFVQSRLFMNYWVLFTLVFVCFRLFQCKACLGTKDEARVQEALGILLKVSICFSIISRIIRSCMWRTLLILYHSSSHVTSMWPHVWLRRTCCKMMFKNHQRCAHVLFYRCTSLMTDFSRFCKSLWTVWEPTISKFLFYELRLNSLKRIIQPHSPGIPTLYIVLGVCIKLTNAWFASQRWLGPE